MNPRERLLALGIVSALLLASGAFVVHHFFLVPLRERQASLALLKKDVETKQERIRQIERDKPRLERWRQLSLPADTDLARREYEKFLSELLRQSGFAGGSFSVTPKPIDTRSSPTLPGKKEPIYTRLTFAVQAHGNLLGTVKLLDRFYRTPLLHQVKNLAIQRPMTSTPGTTGQRPQELDVNLTVEALVAAHAEKRDALLPANTKLQASLLAEPARQYEAIAGKDIFFGPAPTPERSVPEADIAQHVHLTDITRNERRTEAFLYDRYNNRKTRLRASAGFDSFRVEDSQGETLVRGQVVRIEDRELIFRVEEKFYVLHVGQNLEDALRKPLTEAERKTLGLEEKKLEDKK